MAKQRRWVRFVGAVVASAIVVVACSSGGGPSIVDAAIGTWSCTEPGMSEGPHPLSYRVTVEREHTFRLRFVGLDDGVVGKGTWSFHDGKVRIAFTDPGAGFGLLVTGAALDAERIHVAPAGKREPDASETGPIDATVARKGLTQVTFRADEPDAVTWTCRKR